MQIDISPTSLEAGKRAARMGVDFIRNAIRARGEAFIILATGASQFNLLDVLVGIPGIDWSRVTVFHLDEYVGIDAAHTASFVRYLNERFFGRVRGVGEFVAINGDAADIDAEIKRISEAISRVEIDVAFVGIGENGHLAFNDPPADFETSAPYVRVELDDMCRRQQANEGWFASVDDVPTQAISMSIPQIMKSAAIICTVPDARKADAVRSALDGEISNMCPASILQSHAGAHIFLDTDSAKKLRRGRAG